MNTKNNHPAPLFRYVIEYANGATNERKANFSGIGRALQYGRILLDRPTAEAVQIFTPNGQIVEIEKGGTGCPAIRRADTATTL